MTDPALGLTPCPGSLLLPICLARSSLRAQGPAQLQDHCSSLLQVAPTPPTKEDWRRAGLNSFFWGGWGVWAWSVGGSVSSWCYCCPCAILGAGRPGVLGRPRCLHPQHMWIKTTNKQKKKTQASLQMPNGRPSPTLKPASPSFPKETTPRKKKKKKKGPQRPPAPNSGACRTAGLNPSARFLRVRRAPCKNSWARVENRPVASVLGREVLP